MTSTLARVVGALVLVASGANAQSAERTTFYLISGNDTILAERLTRTATSLDGEFADRARGGRLTYSATLLPNGLITRLATRFFTSSADTVGQTASFVLDGDSIVVRMGNAAPARIPSITTAMPMVNPSVTFLEQLIVRARAMGGERAAIPIFIIGAPQPMSATVTWVGADSATAEYAGITLRFAVSRDGRILGGEMPAQRIRIVRGPATDSVLVAPRDYSAPRDAPYTAEDVVITTRAGNKLSGTLTSPRGRVGGRAPAIVTITGSGGQDRDGEPPTLPRYRPFREIADTLGKRGIAVLRLDDRGMGGSDLGPLTVTSQDFADDIRAGIAYLRSRPEIDATRIGLVGHSEGGIIAPMVARTDGQLRALVLMAGSASSGRDIVRSQQHYVIDTTLKLTGAARDSALARSRRSTDSLAQAMPWMKFFLDYEPALTARQVETPVLILQGETDHQVPANEAERLAAAFRAAGNRSVTVRRFPETNHLFVADAVGGFDYAKLPSLRVRPEVLGAIADWLAERLNGR
jgi:dienelactone hydrolase